MVSGCRFERVRASCREACRNDTHLTYPTRLVVNLRFREERAVECPTSSHFIA
jgi:hypothetical protein